MSADDSTPLLRLGNKHELKNPRVNRAFFNAWSPELAWLIGLIWTDGCLNGKCGAVVINAKGRQIPDTVQRLVGERVLVREKYGKPGCYEIAFCDRPVGDFLRSLGLVPAKSRTIEWPPVPAKHEPDFVRGVLDGDGWVSKSTRRRAVGFCGASMSLGRSLSGWLNSNGVPHRVEFTPAPDLFTAPLWRILVNRIGSLIRLNALIYTSPDCPAHQGKRDRYAAILDYIKANGIKPHNRRPAGRPCFDD